MWPAGAASRLPCSRDSALRRAAFSGNLSALPSHLAPSGRSVRVFISANPEGKAGGLAGERKDGVSAAPALAAVLQPCRAGGGAASPIYLRAQGGRTSPALAPEDWRGPNAGGERWKREGDFAGWGLGAKEDSPKRQNSTRRAVEQCSLSAVSKNSTL